MNSRTNNNKRMEGVHATAELQRLLEKALQLAVLAEKNEKEEGKENDPQRSVLLDFAAQDKTAPTKPATSRSSRDKTRQLPSRSNFNHQCAFIPIPVVRAMDAVFQITAVNDDQKDNDAKDLQRALLSTKLYFTPAPGAPALVDEEKKEGRDRAAAAATASSEPNRPGFNTSRDDDAEMEERRKFQHRMQKLRFQNEETKYSKLTSNLNMNAVPDDVTTKSMTYAASIGLNMIVAPISFGVFMYFFAGSLLDYVWPPQPVQHQNYTPPDIKKIIVGVVSGVAMLFIEMLLFVIRTHEMDKAMRKKNKKQKSPFGHYSSSTAKSYNRREEEENYNSAPLKRLD